MSEYAVILLSDYQNICETIRNYTGKPDLIKSGDVSAEIDTITADIDKILDGTATRIKSNATDLTLSFQGHQTISEFIAPNLKNAPVYSFRDCPNMKKVNLKSLETFSEGMFYNDANLEEVISNNAQNFDWGVFYHCEKLKKFDLSKAIHINDSAFNSCTALKFHKISANTIGSSTFLYCTNLTDITFLDTPSFISPDAFYGCTNIIDIRVPWSEGAVAGAPWGAVNATVHYNTSNISFAVFLNGEEIATAQCNTSMDVDRWIASGWSKELEAYGVSVNVDSDLVKATYKGMTYDVFKEDGSSYYCWDWINEHRDFYLVEIGAGN